MQEMRHFAWVYGVPRRWWLWGTAVIGSYTRTARHAGNRNLKYIVVTSMQ